MRLAVCLLTAAVIGLGVWNLSLSARISEAERTKATVEQINANLEAISNALNGFVRDFRDRLVKVEAWRDGKEPK